MLIRAQGNLLNPHDSFSVKYHSAGQNAFGIVFKVSDITPGPKIPCRNDVPWV